VRFFSVGELVGHKGSKTFFLFWVFLFALLIDLGILGLFWFVGYDILIFKKTVSSPYRVVVVEGWLNDRVLRRVADLVNKGSVKRVFVVGNRMEYASNFFPKHTFAEMGRLILIRYGVPKDKIVAVPFDVLRDRTLASAMALKEYLDKRHMDVHAFEILTEDIHSRRTYMTYRAVFGRDIEIGVVPISNGVFDSFNWHYCSEGLKQVFAEDVALLYYWLKLGLR